MVGTFELFTSLCCAEHSNGLALLVITTIVLPSLLCLCSVSLTSSSGSVTRCPRWNILRTSLHITEADTIDLTSATAIADVDVDICSSPDLVALSLPLPADTWTRWTGSGMRTKTTISREVASFAFQILASLSSPMLLRHATNLSLKLNSDVISTMLSLLQILSSLMVAGILGTGTFKLRGPVIANVAKQCGMFGDANYSYIAVNSPVVDYLSNQLIEYALQNGANDTVSRSQHSAFVHATDAYQRLSRVHQHVGPQHFSVNYRGIQGFNQWKDLRHEREEQDIVAPPPMRAECHGRAQNILQRATKWFSCQTYHQEVEMWRYHVAQHLKRDVDDGADVCRSKVEHFFPIDNTTYPTDMLNIEAEIRRNVYNMAQEYSMGTPFERPELRKPQTLLLILRLWSAHLHGLQIFSRERSTAFQTLHEHERKLISAIRSVQHSDPDFEMTPEAYLQIIDTLRRGIASYRYNVENFADTYLYTEPWETHAYRDTARKYLSADVAMQNSFSLDEASFGIYFAWLRDAIAYTFGWEVDKSSACPLYWQWRNHFPIPEARGRRDPFIDVLHRIKHSPSLEIHGQNEPYGWIGL